MAISRGGDSSSSQPLVLAPVEPRLMADTQFLSLPQVFLGFQEEFALFQMFGVRSSHPHGHANSLENVDSPDDRNR